MRAFRVCLVRMAITNVCSFRDKDHGVSKWHASLKIVQMMKPVGKVGKFLDFVPVN